MSAPNNNGTTSDGWSGGSSHTINHNWGSSATGQLYLLAVQIVSTDNTPIGVTTITDGEGNTWRQFHEFGGLGYTTGLSGSPIASVLSVWYAVSASSPSTGSAFTVNFSGTIDSASATVFRIDGVYTSDPFDHDASFHFAEETNLSGTSATPSIGSLSLSAADALVLQVQAALGAGQSISAGSTNGQTADWTDGNTQTNANTSNLEVAAYRMTGTPTSFSSAGGTANNNSLMIIVPVASGPGKFSYSNLFGSDRREPQAVLVTTTIPGGDYAGDIRNLVSGTTSGADASNAIIITTGGVSVSGKVIEFQFPRAVIIDEVTLYQSSASSEGTYNLDVSNDGSTWTTLTTFTWDQLATVVRTGNTTTAYSYMRFSGQSGTLTSGPWLFEVQFSTDRASNLEIGNRSSLITVTTTVTVNTGTIQNIVNGDENSLDVTFNDSNIAGKDITFDFGATSIQVDGIQVITENNSNNYGTWQAQVWDGASWNNISGASFAIGGITPVTFGVPLAGMYTWTGSTSGTKFRLLGVSGTMNDGGNGWHEVNLMMSAPINFMAVTEAQDTFHAIGYPGYPGVHGNLATTEAQDIFAGVGRATAVGSLLVTEAQDRFSAFIKQPLTGHLAATEAQDRFHGTGIGRGEDGVLITTDASDVMHATGTVPIVVVMGAAEAPDRFRALGAGAFRVRRHRALNVT